MENIEFTKQWLSQGGDIIEADVDKCIDEVENTFGGSRMKDDQRNFIVPDVLWEIIGYLGLNKKNLGNIKNNEFLEIFLSRYLEKYRIWDVIRLISKSESEYLFDQIVCRVIKRHPSSNKSFSKFNQEFYNKWFVVSFLIEAYYNADSLININFLRENLIQLFDYFAPGAKIRSEVELEDQSSIKINRINIIYEELSSMFKQRELSYRLQNRIIQYLDLNIDRGHINRPHIIFKVIDALLYQELGIDENFLSEIVGKLGIDEQIKSQLLQYRKLHNDITTFYVQDFSQYLSKKSVADNMMNGIVIGLILWGFKYRKHNEQNLNKFIKHIVDYKRGYKYGSFYFINKIEDINNFLQTIFGLSTFDSVKRELILSVVNSLLTAEKLRLLKDIIIMIIDTENLCLCKTHIQSILKRKKEIYSFMSDLEIEKIRTILGDEIFDNYYISDYEEDEYSGFLKEANKNLIDALNTTEVDKKKVVLSGIQNIDNIRSYYSGVVTDNRLFLQMFKEKIEVLFSLFEHYRNKKGVDGAFLEFINKLNKTIVDGGDIDGILDCLKYYQNFEFDFFCKSENVNYFKLLFQPTYHYIIYKIPIQIIDYGVRKYWKTNFGDWLIRIKHGNDNNKRQ